ncbi:hypothetical protein GE061_013893 [Apolygus lucorum]|uniref:Uncharacterized protein n=1 Tax=Apolygus lucorum TaxID=248454 RepID=A0A8S9XP02_APOLU|nr:hypothetical protein GE061_013893 [Apolygus lucorum]
MVFYVDPKIGGPSNETFNVVPMNPSVAEFWRTNVSEHVYQALKENTERQVGFLICPLYDNVNTTRPHGFIVSVHVRIRPRGATGGEVILGISGFLPNPPKAMSEADEFEISIKDESEVQIEMTGSGFVTGTLKGNRSEDYERVEYRFFTTLMVDGIVVSRCRDEGLRLTQFKKSVRGNDDSPGLLFSQRLGGCLYHPLNVVPMSSKAIYECKTKLENPILGYLKSTNLLNKKPIPDGETPPRYVQFRYIRIPASNYSYVDTSLIVVYSDKFSTRPAGFFFRCTSGPLVVVDNLYIPN